MTSESVHLDGIRQFLNNGGKLEKEEVRRLALCNVRRKLAHDDLDRCMAEMDGELPGVCSDLFKLTALLEDATEDQRKAIHDIYARTRANE